MAGLSDERLIAIARDYGKAVGAKRLAEVMDISERHADRVIKDPPQKLNATTRDALLGHVPDMLDVITRYREKEERAERALREAGAATLPNPESAPGSSVEDHTPDTLPGEDMEDTGE